ncbi:Glycoside hydrolase family 1 - like 4 [Theobroma cacao]|nr:Glycoside hydrolase family 1 - like 4 [Theobroma cacao]
MRSLYSLQMIVMINLAVAVLCADKYSRSDFPAGFVFGSATSAYQVEGAASEDGRAPSIWDTFAHADGRGPVNPKGLNYYNNLINELISHGIQPHVTLHNFDLPQALEDEYGGWINRRIVNDFTTYAEVCFQEFGDRVPYWTTVNEPDVFAVGGYDGGITPPRHCSPPFGVNCTRGNSSSEPYIAVHNILLAHASAARLYKKKYQGKQHGFIGISIYTTGNFPLTNSVEDAIATQRANDFFVGWIVNPLVFGDYPDTMKKIAGSRIPTFTNHESELVRGSFDFLGVIHYSSYYVEDDPGSWELKQRDYNTDLAVKISNVGNASLTYELPILPWGLQAVLEYFKQVYENPPIYILENGQRNRRNSTMEDTSRVNYLHAYIGSVLDAVRILLHMPIAVLCADKYSRYDFPPGFVFGSATAAYQVEGAASENGRTPSIWDTFAHAGYANGATGDVAVDQYHKYKEDVKLMAEMGLDAYRFSISWSRLIPNGRGPLNPKGVQYYNNLISELISHGWRKISEISSVTLNNACQTILEYSFTLIKPISLDYTGIQPHVTLNNADLPQALEDEKDFTAYANVCFREFGDRVSYWTTVNEPNVFAIGGYDQGVIPPRHCSSPFGVNCTRGDSSTEPYTVVHNILLAHASAARLYKRKYQEKQNGFIGISIYTLGAIPNTNSTEDAMAAQRINDFYIGWIANPLVFGDYPDTMKEIVGSRIPTFTNHESELVRGSFDFLGVIHYTTCYVEDDPGSLVLKQRDFNIDVAAKIKNMEDIFLDSEYPILPWGLQVVLEYIKQVYGNPPLYILENGQRTQRNSTLEDTSRVEYLQAYIGSVLDAVRNGSDTRGYFSWSFLDVLEILDGYRSGFGFYYVDLDDPDLKRQPKLSAYWYSHFLKGGSVSSDKVIDLKNNFSALSPGHFRQYDFPPGFIFGSATSAYQVEGAASEDGRSPSIWDTFTHAGYANGATGDIAADHYHKYKVHQMSLPLA